MNALLGVVLAATEAAPSPPPITPETIAGYSSQALLGWFCLLLLGAVTTLWGVIWLRQGRHEQALKDRDAAHAVDLKAAHDANERLRVECAAQIATLQEARLTLMRECVSQLGSSTAAIQLNVQENAERTKTINDLVRTIDQLVSKGDTNRAHFTALGEQLRATVADNSRMLSNLSTTMAGVAAMLGAQNHNGKGPHA